MIAPLFTFAFCLFTFAFSIDPKQGESQAPGPQETEKGDSGWGQYDKTIRALLEFAEEEEKVSVRLRKKRGEQD
jgi:hypothetical protein